ELRCAVRLHDRSVAQIGPATRFRHRPRADPGQCEVRQGSPGAVARHLPRCRRLLGGSQDSLPVLLFFSVARSAQTSQAERANEAQNGAAPAADIEVENPDPSAEKMPTDKLVDVSPLALRMSSPFNAGYWLAAA